MRVLKGFTAALAIMALCLPLMAQAADSWAHKKKLSFDTTATGVELAAQLPMTAPMLSSYGLVNFHLKRQLKIDLWAAGINPPGVFKRPRWTGNESHK